MSGDFALSLSGQTFNSAQASPQLAALDGLNTNGALALSFWGRLEVGFAIYSDNPEWGFFASGLVLNEEDYRAKSGADHWMPSISARRAERRPVHARGPLHDRLRALPGPPGGPQVQHEPDSLHQNFKTAMTLYGVITKSFQLHEIKNSWGRTNLSVSLGFGNGLFSDNGGLGKEYSNQSTGGFFGGLKVDTYPNANSTLSFMVEQNAWQWNIGANYDWRGLRLGLYWMNLFPGAADTGAAAQLYNYSKFAFALSWSSNVLGVVQGDFLQQQETQLTRQVEALQKEIGVRQQKIASLQLEIQRYEAQNLLELEQRRAAAEQALRQEKDALKQLEDRLQKLEQNAPPAKPPR